ncbi:MAG TPA: TonB-dependent receptor [Gammaproteobacteria bacterium]|nr:TonB-dependent receptor [Gammaproteobacteria bacterium]
MRLFERSWPVAVTLALLSTAVVEAQTATNEAAAASSATQPPLDEIVVTADFRDAKITEIPASVSVLDSTQLRATTIEHFEEAIREIPNLNLSGEGSRARYFQLRGVGELEQYDGAPNPSLGFIIDDIDFSGLGSIGTLYDVDRVEVLRGPQGTRYGANALGGLIYMRSAEPSDALSADFEATTGGDDTRALGAAVGGPLGDKAGFRVSVHDFQENGFRHNVFLNRDDTYGRDELGFHGKVNWKPSERVSVDFAGLYIDVDNGYDAWAIDNGLNTYSDKPGRDAQRSSAGSIRVQARLDKIDIVSITGIASTHATFSFDADWGNDAYWAPYTYDYITTNVRERRTYNQEVRVLSKPGAIANGRGDWLVGVYALDLSESNDHLDRGTYRDPICGAACDLDLDNPVTSRYDAVNVAVFGQVRLGLTERLDLTAGLRAERRDARYDDSSAAHFDPRDDMTGGELAFSWRLAPGRSTYLRFARGYKAGGFNVSLAGVDFSTIDNAKITPSEIEFGPELLTSIEGGYRFVAANGRASADVGVFYARREDEQIKVPLQLRLGDPSSFLFVTANAQRATLSGVEGTFDWRATERLDLSAAVGLLETKIERFSLFPELEGREQAHAPPYTFSLAAEYRVPSGWFGRIDLSGMGAFFFDYGYDVKSSPYALTNLKVGRDWGRWSAALWGRNVLNERYAVRGFYFGNEPPDFPNKLYTRQGDPRQYGVTVRYRF